MSNPNPWQGEQVIVTHKIYFLIPIQNYSIDKQPRNKGFWAEDLTPQNGRVKQYEEVVNGRRYKVAEIRRSALFPQQSGELIIDPLDINVLAIVQASRRRTGTMLDLFDDPFFNPAQAIEQHIQAKQVKVNVKALPSPPDNYSNAVGNFSVSGGLTLDSVKAGEALSYRLTVSGHGNLMLINPPSPQFPASFEVYDPQTQDKISRNDNGISGSRTFEWIIIPQEKGIVTIPAYQFVFFNPSTGKYVTLSVKEQHLNVMPSNGINNPNDSTQANAQTSNHSNIKTILLYSLSALAVLLVIFFIVRWLLKHCKRDVDPVAQRKRNALSLARRRLKQASTYLKAGQPEPFYQEIYRALWGCLSDKYNIPLSQLDRESVKKRLEEKQVGIEQQQVILGLLDEVDLARFAPGNPETFMNKIYEQTLMVISEI